MDKLIFLVLSLIIANHCFGHSYSTSYLRIQPDASALKAEWKIPLSDLDRVLDLDLNSDNRISTDEVDKSENRIIRYTMNQFSIEQNQIPCQSTGNHFALDSIESTPAIYLAFRVTCKQPISEKHPLILNYQLFQQENPWHRGIVSVHSKRGLMRYVLSKENSKLILAQDYRAQTSFFSFLVEGIWHIYIGLDHILFLLTLIVPVVLHRASSQEFTLSRTRSLCNSLLTIVTAFTLAHSVTLILAATDSYRLPSQTVETGIAVSIVVGAILALFPSLDRWRWLLALGFGFIHGFGFANVLAELMTPGQVIYSDLVGFNIGVELGQLSIVAALVPLLLILSRVTILRYRLLLPSMTVIVAFGLLWVLQRGFGITLDLMT